MTTFNDSFVWPEYKTDRERIRAISRKYKNYSVVDAFAEEYGIKPTLSQELRDVLDNFIPIEPKIGDLLEVVISDITKNKVVFDNINLKNELVSKVNLYKYEKFREFIPKYPVKVMVTGVDKRRVTVDPLMPLLDSWMNEYIGGKDKQKVIGNPQIVKVKNLRLTKGGFMGDAVINKVSKFIGEDFTVPAFIPGSQIVLNIAENFESFIGKDVDAFVVNYLTGPDNNISLICSSKEYFRFLGECNMIKIFNAWCEENEYWKMVEATAYEGKVTGIINSSKKCGVFVEIPSLNITGLISMKPEELVNYKPHTDIMVKISGFDEETFFNQAFKQTQHVEPYIIKDGVLEKCNLKPILTLA